MLNPNVFYVYAYLRSKDGKYGKKGTPYYIGKGKDNRAYVKHGRIYLPKDKNNIVFLLENLSENTAFEMEMMAITLFGRIDLGTGCLRNLTDGGDGLSGRKKSSKEKLDISNRMKGNTIWLHKHHSKESRKKMSESTKGKIVSEVTKRKMRNNNLGKKLATETKEKIGNALRGKLFSEERKQKLRKPKPERTKEHSKKISEENQGKTFSKVECPYCSNLISINRIKAHLSAKHIGALLCR